MAVSPKFYGWLFGFGTEVEILSPENVSEEYKEEFSNLAEMYRIGK